MLLVAAAADDCCWVQRSVKGTTFKKPTNHRRVRHEHRCFAACRFLTCLVRQGCTCDPTIVARRRTSLAKRTSCSTAERLRGAWLAPMNLGSRPLGALMVALWSFFYGVFMEPAVWRSALPESLYVMPVAYELPWWREILGEAMRRVDAVINWQLRDLCGTTPRRWPLYDKTGAIVAFFGGVSRIRYVDVEGAASTKVDTGNAHSLQPRSIKVRALKASVCSLLRDVASVVGPRFAIDDTSERRGPGRAGDRRRGAMRSKT